MVGTVDYVMTLLSNYLISLNASCLTIIIVGRIRRPTRQGTDRDGSASYVRGAAPFVSAAERRHVIKNRPRNKTCADVLDGVLRSPLNATRRARGRWLAGPGRTGPS